jgi:diaminopimelate decarboxylase
MNYNNIETPFYIINKKILDANFYKLKESLDKYWNNYIIGYSYKTNALPWIIDFFDKKGCYSEVVSDDEYSLGKILGIKKDKFIYNGPIKTEETFLEAAKNKCIINIDSKRELEWTKKIDKNSRIGLRINFDIEKYCPKESQCGDEGGRFGFCYENGELKKAIECLKKNEIIISGIHLHVSSKTRSLKIYESIAKMATKIIDEFDLELEYIDIGGGFFGGMEDKPQFEDYLKVISKVLKEKVNPKKTKLIIEPGISLIGPPISYITSVIDVKETTYNRFVITDGSRTNIDPLMSKKNYFYRIEQQSKNDILQKQVICGYTCMEHDRLFTYENGNELVEGDKIIYDKVGAYTMCLTPLFIKYFPDVYILDEKGIKKIRNKWTPKQYIQNNLSKDD